MGALVGGAYASGRDAEDLEKAMLAIDWGETIGFSSQRQRTPMRRKLAGATFSNSLEFGVRNGRMTAPSGFIKTQNIEQTIHYLVARSRGIEDFDQLPIRYRAIATDMQSGQMVVLASGNLTQAMRASMAVPGIFSPVVIDDVILGDGGLARNVPVDVARETCADVVIAVAVPNPVPTLEELQSPLTLVGRTLDVLIGANEKQQLDSLRPEDTGIVIDMGDIGSGSFDKTREAIPLGRAAALAHRDELARYSLPEAEYLAWRSSVSRDAKGPVTIGEVTITGYERVNPDFIRHVLGIQPGEVLDERKIAERVNHVHALGDFDAVHYVLRGDPASPTLEVRVQEQAIGSTVVRFDLGMYVGTSSNTAFTLGGDVRRTWINQRGGELHGALRVGRTSALEASLYQPLDPQHEWFVEPGLNLQRSLEDLYVDGEAVARYDLSHAYGYFDVGRVFGTRAELRAGIRSGWQWAEREIASPDLPGQEDEQYGGFSLRYTMDTRDRNALFRSGMLARAGYFRGDELLGAESEYDRLEGLVTWGLPVGDDMVYLRAAGGTSVNSDLPLYDLFVLGGPVSFPGLEIGQLRGQSYWSGQASYLYKVADISTLFGQSLYAGLRLSAGDVGDRIDGIDADPVYSAAALLGGRTPIGPVALTVAHASEGGWQLVLVLGRPIEERSITDPIW
jgi:NTE family protein